MAQWAENVNGNQLTTTDTVGIGTTSPMGLLHVNGNDGGGLVVSGTNLDPNAGYSLTPLQNSGNLLVGWNRSAGGGEIDLISNRYAGNVGGFTFYDYTNSGGLSALLTIGGSGVVNIPGELVVSGQGWSSISALSTNMIAMGDPGTQDTLFVGAARGGKLSVMDGLTATKVRTSQYTPSSILNLVSWVPNAPGPALTLTNLGGGANATVAINFTTSAPPAAAPTTARIDAIDLGNGSSHLTFYTMTGAPGGGLNPRMVITGDGNVGIGTVPSSRLHVVGDATVTGDVLLTGADCAEDFDVVGVEPLEPGTVVIIGEDGALLESSEPYDKKVAGVVSGAGEYRHGLVLDKRPSDEGRVPVALMGKVYCKVDAQYSPIEVGDLLTTAPTPGHAMKASEPAKAFGAIIGKALKPLEQGRALIPILVALQ